MNEEKLENRLFYNAVVSLGDNPTKRDILQAYDVGVREAQSIADQGFNATCGEYKYGIRELLEEGEMWYRSFIKGYHHFADQSVNQDLDTLFSNVTLMLRERDDRLKSESNGVISQDRYLGQDIRQKERRNVDFYQSILDLGSNPSKKEVYNTFHSWIEEADCMVDEFLQVDLEEQFSEYNQEMVRWRHAFIKGYPHFVKYNLNQEVSNLFSKTMALLGGRKSIACNVDERYVPMRKRSKFDREVNYRRELRQIAEKWRLQNETAKK